MQPTDLLIFELNKLVGEECWGVVGGAGTGSIISLDFGKQIPRNKPLKNPYVTETVRNYESEFRLMLYCPWRIESRWQVISGSHMSNENDGPMVSGLHYIRGKKILAVTCTEPAYDLRIRFVNEVDLVVHCSLIGMDDDTCYSLSAPHGVFSVCYDGKVRFTENVT